MEAVITIQTKTATLTSLLAQHVGTNIFQRVSAFVHSKVGTKLQAFLADANVSDEKKHGLLDEVIHILQSKDWEKLPAGAGAQAAGSAAAQPQPAAPAKPAIPAPAPLIAPPPAKVNGHAKPEFTVPTNGIACTEHPDDPAAQMMALFRRMMPKAEPAAVDENAVRRLVRDEMATILESIATALRK